MWHRENLWRLCTICWVINRYAAGIGYAEKTCFKRKLKFWSEVISDLNLPLWAQPSPSVCVHGWAPEHGASKWLKKKICQNLAWEKSVLHLKLILGYGWSCSVWNFYPRIHAWGKHLAWKTWTKLLKFCKTIYNWKQDLIMRRVKQLEQQALLRGHSRITNLGPIAENKHISILSYLLLQ